MARKLITGIDIGTSAIRVIVCEYVHGKEQPQIVATGYRESRGIRHGYVVNFDDAARALAEAVDEASQTAEIKIKRALLAIGGVSLSSSASDGSIAVSRADSEITDMDIERAIDAARGNLKEIANRRILHTVPQYYKLDGKKIWGRPHGLRGGILETRTLFITCLEQHHNDLVSVVEAAGITVDDVFAAPIAESVVSLTRLQKQAGCVLANIGAETVSIVVFEEGIPVSLSVFPMGSMNITSDIALGLRIPIEEAERIKRTRDDSPARRKVSEIIEARLTDIFELIEAHLKKIGRNGLLPAGIILSGGGSFVPAIDELAKDSLRLPARVAQQIHGLKDPSWAIAYGLPLLWSDEEAEESLGIRIARQTTSGVLGWLKHFMP